MFAEVEFEWTVLVQPYAMRNSAHIQRAVILSLLKDFNDVKCTAQHGYHVVLTTLENVGEGRLWERRGCAAFPVRFRCVVFNVFKNEHVLAVVTESFIHQLCNMLDKFRKYNLGPWVRTFASASYKTSREAVKVMMSKDADPNVEGAERNLKHSECLIWQAQSSGVMCQCGPVEVLFISKKHMKDYEFLSTEVDSLAVTKWRNTVDGTSIKKGDVIRVKILGTKWEPAQRALSAVGSLLGDYAGVDNRWPELNEMPKQAGATDDGGWGESPTGAATDNGGWRESPTRGATDNGGWGESPTKDATDHGGWGESPTKDATDHGGWGDPDVTDTNDNCGWGEPPTKGASDNSGWGESMANDDDIIGPSGWD